MCCSLEEKGKVLENKSLGHFKGEIVYIDSDLTVKEREDQKTIKDSKTGTRGRT